MLERESGESGRSLLVLRVLKVHCVWEHQNIAWLIPRVGDTQASTATAQARDQSLGVWVWV